MGFAGFRGGIGGWGDDSAPKPLEIHLRNLVVRRIDTYVEDLGDGVRIYFFLSPSSSATVCRSR